MTPQTFRSAAPPGQDTGI